MSEYWQPDKETYDELQQLRVFLSFVANLKEATNKDKEAEEKIDAFIVNIDKIETKRTWNICLDIFDYDIQMGLTKEEGIYHRRWWVKFAINSLEIETRTDHSTEEPFAHYGNDYDFFYRVDFRNEINWERKDRFSSIEDLVADVKKYKHYMNESMRNVEVEIAFK